MMTLFYYLIVILIIVFSILALMCLYYFSKQQYDNFYVKLFLTSDSLKLLKANQISHTKIKIILTSKIAIFIILGGLIIYFFNSDNITIKYILICSLFINKFIANKLIEKTFAT